MAFHKVPKVKGFADRYFYNSNFVNSQLLNSNYVQKLKSLCRFVKPSVSYAEVAKKGQPRVRSDQSSQATVKCFNLTPQHVEMAKGKTVKLYSSNIESPRKSVIQRAMCESQCGSHMCHVTDSIGESKCKHEIKNQFVHNNPYAILTDIDFSSVNNCQPVNVSNVLRETEGQTCHEASVLMKNGRNLNKGKRNQIIASKPCHPSTSATKDGSGSGKTEVPIQSSKRQANTECQGGGVTVDTLISNTTAELQDDDKYELEIQNNLKKSKIQVARRATENELCIQQNRPLFGFIPIYGLKSRVYDTGNNSVCTDILELHKKLRQDGRHNYAGLQIPLVSNLNYDKWARYLTSYWDWQLPLLIKYGFPLDFDRNSDTNSDKTNHKSAIEYPDHVTTYLQEELHHGAMLGPFPTPPIENLHVSPFMTRDKSSSANRRVIIDLSWPHGLSVNSGVENDRYLGTDFVLTYPSIDNITSEVLKLGKGCQIFKIDISRAFRHVPIDPGDLDLLGLYWEGHFIDRSLPFGFKHGSSIFQRLSDAVRFIMRQEGHSIWNYIDDFLCVSLPSKIGQTFTRLQDLLTELGLTISAKKLVPPGTKVICLGIQVDTENLSISIPSEKLETIKYMCQNWVKKSFCTKRELQSLLGSLLYVAKCIKYARFFLNRMLTLLRENAAEKRIRVTEEFKSDLKWFNSFLSVYNGVSFFNYAPSQSVHLDACPSGLGAIFGTQVYALPLPQSWQDVNIAYTEMINILVALKVWHLQWAGLRVRILCDNEAVVSVLNTGRTRDRVMAMYARNVFLWLSAFNIDIQVVHIPGKMNPVADLLSRWHKTVNNVPKLQALIHPVTWIHTTEELLYCNKNI